jgi:HEAT repeat protein
LIENALNSSDQVWQVSALIAMGRSANDFWRPQVMSMLKHTSPLIRTEAARAAGELVIEEARASLFDLVDDTAEETSTAALWALSQIGGKEVRKILQDRLNAAEDDSEVSFLESALENLDFMDGLGELGLMGVEDINWDEPYAHQDEEDDFYCNYELKDNESDLDDERDGFYYEDDLDEDAFDSLLK